MTYIIYHRRENDTEFIRICQEKRPHNPVVCLLFVADEIPACEKYNPCEL